MNDLCPCGSGQPYGSCCEPFHRGHALPETAQQLMRSRYSAFALKQSRYLLANLHPSRRRDDDQTELQNTLTRTEWTGLSIVSERLGGPGDTEGWVAFRAGFRQGGGQGAVDENSYFVRQQGRWWYLEGESPPASSPGRNEPCWCGSGRKFKKCHG
ncbi:MAG: zinc chelation protein SecC [Pseudomonadales bacterium]|nr:zinc chelation protein SecC [Pseudomonadales bacterium]